MRSDRGLDRLITFLDAVGAIAITLLVLPLIELLAGASTARDVGTLLGDHVAQFGSFALSFVVIARLWVAHHALTERVGAYDGPFLLINLSWAFTVVLLPFATQVTAVYGSERLAVGLYVGTVTASSACVSALSVLVRRRPALRREGGRGRGRAPGGVAGHHRPAGRRPRPRRRRPRRELLRVLPPLPRSAGGPAAPALGSPLSRWLSR